MTLGYSADDLGLAAFALDAAVVAMLDRRGAFPASEVDVNAFPFGDLAHDLLHVVQFLHGQRRVGMVHETAAAQGEPLGAFAGAEDG